MPPWPVILDYGQTQHYRAPGLALVYTTVYIVLLECSALCATVGPVLVSQPYPVNGWPRV